MNLTFTGPFTFAGLDSVFEAYCFNTHIKPKVNQALLDAGVQNMPKSWENSIYQQAAEASRLARSMKNST